VSSRPGKCFFIVQDGIRMELLKALYQVMLVELPREDILEFWRSHPITLFKGPLPPKIFLRFLWKGCMSVQPEYFWSVLHDLQSCLVKRGIDGERFFQLLNHGFLGGPPLDPGWVVQTMPSPEILGTSVSDPREWLLLGLDRLLARLLPGCRIERIPEAEESRHGSSLYLFHPLPGRPLPFSDFRLFPGLLVKSLPKLFGWSPFASVEVLADMRSPGLVIGGADGEEWNWKGDILRHRKRTMGRLASLKEFLDPQENAQAIRNAMGLSMDRPVIVMERDFPHASRNQPVLRKGCAYGAPFTLARVGYVSSRRWGGLSERLSWKRPAPVPGPGRSFKSAEMLHLELLAFPG
jgi:hypothetical protein